MQDSEFSMREDTPAQRKGIETYRTKQPTKGEQQ